MRGLEKFTLALINRIAEGGFGGEEGERLIRRLMEMEGSARGYKEVDIEVPETAHQISSGNVSCLLRNFIAFLFDVWFCD